MLSIGFTGTQKGMSDKQKMQLLGYLSQFDGEFHHGDCIGADAEAHEIVKGMVFRKYKIVIHPPEDASKRAFCAADREADPKPYLERNHDIVDACDVLLAAPDSMSEKLRSGTWATVRYARKTGTQVVLLERR